MHQSRSIGSAEGYQRLARVLLDDLRSYPCHAHEYPAHHEVLHEGDDCSSIFYVAKGWLYTYNALPDGGRQITMVHQPADIVSVAEAGSETANMSLRTVTACVLYPIPRAVLRNMNEVSAFLEPSLLYCARRDQAILRRMLVAVGRMDARCRVLTLLLILLDRQTKMTGIPSDVLNLPLTQTEIGDLTGLTNVSVSRVMCQLADDGFIRRQGGTVVMCRLSEMNALACYKPLEPFAAVYGHYRSDQTKMALSPKKAG